jgi:acyl-coenzyme A thioesterase PaaI-like protein
MILFQNKGQSMTQDLLDGLRQRPLPFATFAGVEPVSANPDCVEAMLPVRKELCTIPDILHGGAVMALVDTLGGSATFLNLPQSKTMVWQTRVTRADGRLAAIVTQTQLVL